MFTTTRTTTRYYGGTIVHVRFTEPVALKLALTTTTVARHQDRSIGELPPGTLVRGLLTNDAAGHVWLEVSSDGGSVLGYNERAAKLGPVLEALGVDGLAQCDGCALPYNYAEGRDDAQGGRVCRHCQERSARKSGAER